MNCRKKYINKINNSLRNVIEEFVLPQYNKNEKAMECYQRFLVDYPGSLFSAEARTRFRNLRGDFSGPM